MISSTFDIVLFDRYLENHSKLAPRTQRFYVKVITQYLKTNPNIHDPESYQNFLVETAIKKRNPANKYALMYWLKFKITNHEERKTILKQIKMLNITQKQSKQYIDKKPLTDEEIFSLLNILKKNYSYKHFIMSLIMFECGARVGDILNIKHGAIKTEAEQGNIVMRLNYIAKGDKRTTKWIYNKIVTDEIWNYLESCPNDTEYVFVDEPVCKSNRMDTPKQISKVQDNNRLYYWKDLKMALAQIHIDPDRFAAHCFRRLFANKVWDWSHNIDTTQKMLGHARAETTLVYLKQQGYDTKDIAKDFHMRNSST